MLIKVWQSYFYPCWCSNFIAIQFTVALLGYSDSEAWGIYPSQILITSVHARKPTVINLFILYSRVVWYYSLLVYMYLYHVRFGVATERLLDL